MDTRAMMEGTKAGVDKQAKRQRTHLLTSDATYYALIQLQSYKQSWLIGKYQWKKLMMQYWHSHLSHILKERKKEKK